MSIDWGAQRVRGWCLTISRTRGVSHGITEKSFLMARRHRCKHSLFGIWIQCVAVINFNSQNSARQRWKDKRIPTFHQPSGFDLTSGKHVKRNMIIIFSPQICIATKKETRKFKSKWNGAIWSEQQFSLVVVIMMAFGLVSVDKIQQKLQFWVCASIWKCYWKGIFVNFG